jgi:hypothetical protein
VLTLEALRAEMARVTYKPGWSFRLYQHRWEGVWLAITVELPDAEWPSRMMTICVRTAVPPIPHATYLHEWLAYRLGRTELHEMREFLRVDGEKIYDPHVADANE